MTTSQHPEERLLRIALAATAKPARSPDVTLRVVHAMREDDAGKSPPSMTTESSTSPWRAAAMVLLGIAVVVTAVLTRQSNEESPATTERQDPIPLPDPVRQDPQFRRLPPPIMVVARRGAAAPNAETRNVILTTPFRGPVSFAVCEDMPLLERARLGEGNPMKFVAQANSSPPNDWLAPIAKCTNLRTLEIKMLPGFQVEHLTALTTLPKLETLILDHPQVRLDESLAALLADLPALRNVEFANVAKLSEAGITALAPLSLERLHLAVPGAPEQTLRALGKLKTLRELRLVPSGGTLMMLMNQLQQSSITPTDLASLPALESLELPASALTARHVEVLPKTLRRLAAMVNPQDEERLARAVLALPKLDDLALFAGNPSGADAVEFVVRATLANRPMRRLALAMPPSLELATDLGQQIALERLETVVDDDARDLSYVLRLPSLRSLRVRTSSANLGIAECLELCEPLKSTRRLRHLEISGLDDPQMDAIRELLGEEVTITRVGSAIL